jgi:hypothetical protein
LKYITTNVLHVVVSGSFGDNLWEIQHGALDIRERRLYGCSGPAKATGNIDKRG